MSTGQRMFVAVLPPEHVVEHLDEFLAARREHAPFRWTPPEHLHLTLAFVAVVPDRALDGLVDGVRAAAARRTPFATSIAGGGAWPDPSQAKVLVADVGLDDAAAAELDRLAAGVRTAAGRAGLVVDGQRFRPHVTLARLGRRTEVTRWVRLLDGYRGPAWTVDRVAVVASHLGEGPRGGPRHEVVDEAPLAGSADVSPAAPPRSR